MLLTTGDVNRDFEEHGIILPKTGPVDHVVVGDAGDAVTYETLNRAFRLVNDGAGLIALEKDRFWMGPDGLLLSAGPIVAALEYATGKSATVMGKPSPDFFGSALAAMGLSTADVTMIGDDIITDIAGARSAGMAAVLVRTGKFSEDTLRSASVQPTAVIDSIARIAEIL